MDYSAYRKFDQTFRAKYAELFERYPFAAMLIEKQLRNHESGATVTAQLNMRRLARHNYIKKLRADIALRFRKNPAQSDRFYLKLDRFSSLRSSLISRLAERDIHPVEDEDRWGMGDKRLLQQLATRGRALPAFMRRSLNEGFAAALSDTPLMQCLDREAHQNLDRMKGMVEALRIRFFIADGDTLPFSRLMCVAAKDFGLPYVVIAHGYVQNLQLVSIAPIYGDYLVTWTQQQADDIRAALPDDEREKVLYFGYPKDVLNTAASGNDALIAWHPLHEGAIDEEAQTLRTLIDELQKAGYRSRLRLHPKETRRKELVALLESGSFTLSKDKLVNDLTSSAIVIGSRSSVLVEAAMSGKKVFQLTKYADTSFEGVTALDLTYDFCAAVSSAPVAPSPQPFDLDDFVQFLTDASVRCRAP